MAVAKFGWCAGHESEVHHEDCPQEFYNNVSEYTLKCDCDCHEQK